MGKVYTNWTKAIISPNEAMMGLLSCLNAGKNAWIETRKNTDAEIDYPIRKKNPELDNPFNWTMNFGTPRNDEALKNYSYFNETEEDLTYNWTACFGTKEAVKKYQTEGTVTEGMINGGSISHPVRIADANRYRKEILGDDYKCNYWTTWWKPKDGIPYYVVDEGIEDVFIICYDDGPVNHKEAAIKASQFLADYAARMEV